MIVIFCIFALVQSFLALPFSDYGEKILGGRSVPIEEYPYTISLRYMNSHLCGASILSKRYVITAAHCTKGFNQRLLSIQYGITTLDDEDGPIIEVEAVYQHPQFNMAIMDYDLSILKLSEDIEFSERALPIDIAKTNTSLVGEVGVVTGWGVNHEEGGDLTKNLQAVEVPVLDQKFCKEKYKSLSPISPRMFCAGYPDGGKDSCQGDSGGPFAVDDELVGVVSWGWGCGEAEYPGVYANISAMKTFIQAVLGSQGK